MTPPPIPTIAVIAPPMKEMISKTEVVLNVQTISPS